MENKRLVEYVRTVSVSRITIGRVHVYESRKNPLCFPTFQIFFDGEASSRNDRESVRRSRKLVHLISYVEATWLAWYIFSAGNIKMMISDPPNLI